MSESNNNHQVVKRLASKSMGGNIKRDYQQGRADSFDGFKTSLDEYETARTERKAKTGLDISFTTNDID